MSCSIHSMKSDVTLLVPVLFGIGLYIFPKMAGIFSQLCSVSVNVWYVQDCFIAKVMMKQHVENIRFMLSERPSVQAINFP